MMRYWIVFAKNEEMRYTGHLDLHHTLERTFRRAQLPVAYSQGYTPRPKLNLGSPLPLGIISLGELAEVRLTENLPEGEILDGLREVAPPGLRFLRVMKVPEGTPKLPNLILAAWYEIKLLAPPQDLANQVADLLEAETLIRTRGSKTYDLRPLVELLQIEENDRGEKKLVLRLKAVEGATGRADEVLAALGLQPADALTTRTGLDLKELPAEENPTKN